jgi:hypothetical protein
MPTKSIDSIVSNNGNSTATAINFKAMVGLFVIIMIVCSKFFENVFISKIKYASDGKRVNILGTAIKGIIIVLLYIILNYLMEIDVI